jgi:hypothetical protein
VTAVPRHLYLADHPEHADLIPAPTKYVILMGHRRHAATRLAGLPDVPVIVRTDPATIGRDLIAMAVENLHRLDLTPIQEARAYAQLRDLGLPQREIGRRVGVSQTKVSRLLSLLELPPAAQQDVARGTLPVAEALDMLRGGNAPKPAPATTPAPDVPPPTAAPRPTPAARPAAATAPAVVDRAVAAATVATGNLPRQNYLAAALAAAVLRSAGPGSLELAHQWLTPGHPALASSTPAAWARAVADTGAAPGLTRAAWAVAVAADELAGQPGPREDAHRARLAVAGWVDANRITGGTP